MKAFPVLILTALFTFGCFVSGLTAATPAKPPAPVDERKLIKSVDVKSSTLVIVYMRDKTTHAYKVDDITALKINNVAGKIADIKAGMVVEDYLERDGQTLDGLTLSGYGATPTAAKPKAKPPAKPKPPAQT